VVSAAQGGSALLAPQSETPEQNAKERKMEQIKNPIASFLKIAAIIILIIAMISALIILFSTSSLTPFFIICGSGLLATLLIAAIGEIVQLLSDINDKAEEIYLSLNKNHETENKNGSK